jgi:hypothetical protein
MLKYLPDPFLADKVGTNSLTFSVVEMHFAKVSSYSYHPVAIPRYDRGASGVGRELDLVPGTWARFLPCIRCNHALKDLLPKM